MKRILVLVDERPESLIGVERAADVASRTGAELIVLSVLEPISGDLDAWPVGEDRDEMARELARAEVEWQTARMQDALAGRAARVVARWGKPCATAVRLAIDESADLVIKTAQGRHGSRRVFFGSTALHLFRKCPCPVWVVSDRPVPVAPTVLAAVDPAHGALTTKVLRNAEQLAGWLDAELHVIHVWDAPHETSLRRRYDADRAQAHVDQEEARARAGLERALGALSSPPDRVELVRGDTADEVPTRGADVIVMGSVGQTGIRGLLIGEMAEEILSRIDTSVFQVKPDGFESPLSQTPPRRERRASEANLDVHRLRRGQVRASTTREAERRPTRSARASVSSGWRNR